jgi:pyrroline-5-carboxylate reductase
MTSDEPARVALGFVGTGTINAAMVTGLCTDPAQPYSIRVSPRNAAVAARLAARFDRVRVGASNQEVIDASDVVFLAVRPQIAADILAPLRFGPDKRIISLIATFSRQKVATLVGSVQSVTCAVPQPTVAARLSPTAIFPPDAFAAGLFDRLGTAFPATSESEFRALFATTAAMASFFSLLAALARWLTSHGVDAAIARDYVAKMFHGLADVPQRSTLDFGELAAEFKTKGGLNEQLADELAAKGVFGAFPAGLDAILARLVKHENPG